MAKLPKIPGLSKVAPGSPTTARPLFPPSPMGPSAFVTKLTAHPHHLELRRRLTEGASPQEMLAYVREHVTIFAEFPDNLVLQGIADYRKTIPNYEFRVHDGTITEGVIQGEIVASINEIEELESVIRIQRKRVQIGAAFEEKTGLLSPQLDKTIELYADMLSRSATLKVGLGFYRQGSKGAEAEDVSLAGKDTAYGSEAIKTVMETPESRRKVIRMAERIAALQGARQALTSKLLEARATPASAPTMPSVEAPKTGTGTP